MKFYKKKRGNHLNHLKMSCSEQQAYESMIFLFYVKVFGLVKSSITSEMGDDFDTHCVNEEGWDNIEQVYEFAEMVKGMSKKERTKFMGKCPSRFLKKFVVNELK